MTDSAPIIDIPSNPRPNGAVAYWVKGAAGKRVRACAAPGAPPDAAHGAAPGAGPARGSAIICPGRTEFIEKYFEVARELQARGFATVIMDVRGQGLSDRFMKDRLPGHIDSLDLAARDLAAAAAASPVALPKPYVVFAHSMGGAIALRALQTKRIDAAGAVFSAPMWGLDALKGPRLLAVRILNALGFGKQHPAGAAGDPGEETFETNPVTHDRARWERTRALISAEPGLALGGVTIGWAVAAARAIALLQHRATLKRLATPLLAFTAEEEKLVANWSHPLVTERAPAGEHVTIPRAMHEILQETDEVRAQFWARTDAFLEKVAPPAAAASA